MIIEADENRPYTCDKIDCGVDVTNSQFGIWTDFRRGAADIPRISLKSLSLALGVGFTKLLSEIFEETVHKICYIQVRKKSIDVLSNKKIK